MRGLSVALVAIVVVLSLVPTIASDNASAAPVVIEAYQAVVIPPTRSNVCREEVAPMWKDTPRYVEPVTGATIAFKHNEGTLYFYAEWQVATPSVRDYFGVEFDNNGDGMHMGDPASPDDAFFLSPTFYALFGNCARDAYLTGFARQTHDDEAGAVNDAKGRMTYINGSYFIEVERPFVTGDGPGYDVDLAVGTSIGVGFAAGQIGAGSGHRGTDMSTYVLSIANKTSTVAPEVTIADPVSLAYDAGIFLIVATLALIAFHFFRRRSWRKTPVFGAATPKAPVPYVMVRRHTLSIRAIHWAHAGLMLSLIATGLGVHWRVYLLGTLTTIVHVGIGLTILLVDFPLRFTALWKAKELGVLVKPLKEDFREIGGITANLFGLSKTYPEHSTFEKQTRRYFLDRKYCAFQKAMLWGDVMGIVAIAITGMALYTSHFGWVTGLLGGSLNVRAVHAFLFFYFAATLIGHVYLSVIPYNWGKMSAMVSGVGQIREHVPTAEEDEAKEGPSRVPVPSAKEAPNP